MATIARIILLLALVASCTAFVQRFVASRRNAILMASDAKKEQWPGNRPPLPHMELLEQRMDATWGRGRYREEVWVDKGNPSNEWWLAYTPSEEEAEAAAKGYNFTDLDGFFKEKGIDYDKAFAEARALADQKFQVYLKEKKAARENFDIQKFFQLQKQLFDLQRVAYDVAFKLADNELQKAKGQPTHDEEDTCEHYHNEA